MKITARGLTIQSACLMVLLIGRVALSQTKSVEPIRLMFYNSENFFDIYDDTLTDDNDFLPGGVMRWNYSRYEKKLNSLYKTIVATGEWEPPSIIAFCEIEKRKILEDLIYGSYLSKFKYGIIHEESPDRRGIDVCLIYRKDIIHEIGYKYLVPVHSDTVPFTSRSVLYARLLIRGDTINLFVNHWPSRRGGVLAGEGNRQQIAEMVRQNIDSILEADKESRIILIGDFNCTPDDQVIRTLTCAADSDKMIINLSEMPGTKAQGTYRYMGSWEIIDQVLVSKNMLYCKSGICTSAKMLSILKTDFLLQKDPGYPGSSPFSTYRGYKYQGGYSDHLPVLIDLMVR
jgi:hypothetical protein